jgi:hypothetical protein
LVKGRKMGVGLAYSYGFNGHEKNDEINADHYDFGGNGLDTRLGRRWNIDPMSGKHPDKSPYSFAADNPIYYVDKDGNDYGVYFYKTMF